MRLAGKNPGKALGVALLFLLAWTMVPGRPARAAAQDLALFYDALAPYGAWVSYGHYGPVWYPTSGVTANWRPYVDGRWLPTEQGSSAYCVCNLPAANEDLAVIGSCAGSCYYLVTSIGKDEP